MDSLPKPSSCSFSRLRAAALILGVGFLLFFIRNAFVVDFHKPLQVFVWLCIGGIAAMQGVISFILHRHCPECPIRLRMFELLIFGAPMIEFFNHSLIAAYQFVHEGLIPIQSFSPVVPWVMLIFVYTLFIPNTWKRAAIMLGLIGLIPSIMFFGVAIYTESATPIYSLSSAITNSLMLLVAVLTGVWGVYNMTRLRTEAFEARQMGNYKLLRKIGAGGMGEVYLAEHQLMKRPVAIKLIHPNQSHDPHAWHDSNVKFCATAKLSHWNSIEIYDYGRTPDGTFYYVMEFLPGMSVSEMVESYGPMPGERVVYLLQQVCEGLGEAHSLNLIHRDLKPGNIFSAFRGGYYDVAKLLDFGLSEAADEHEFA